MEPMLTHNLSSIMRKWSKLPLRLMQEMLHSPKGLSLDQFNRQPSMLKMNSAMLLLDQQIKQDLGKS